MFGYIATSPSALTEEEKTRYRAVYCGLCHMLGGRCSQLCRFALTYDMAFLIVLLGSMYEPVESSQVCRCLPHPLKPHRSIQTSFSIYAADASVMLGYWKCADNWQDDHSLIAKFAMAALKEPFEEAMKRQPLLGQAVVSAMHDIRAMEQTQVCNPEDNRLDAVANRFGLLLGDVFSLAAAGDRWQYDLAVFGARLGKFIYVMDAAVDYDKDKKSGSYNPLVFEGISPQEAKDMLLALIASATDAFERLPLEQDLHVLRSVLYVGVWQRYRMKYQSDEAASLAGENPVCAKAVVSGKQDD